jgi:hypothetical protein
LFFKEGGAEPISEQMCRVQVFARLADHDLVVLEHLHDMKHGTRLRHENATEGPERPQHTALFETQDSHIDTRLDERAARRQASGLARRSTRPMRGERQSGEAVEAGATRSATGGVDDRIMYGPR